MSDFFRDLVNEIKDEGTSIAGDGKGAAEFTGYVDTGCYMLNAVLSGSLYGGLPNNKITGIAGESSTGKTFIALGIVRNFLNANPTGGVAYFDTEAAVTTDMLIDRDIDPNRVIIAEPDTLQKFRHQALTMIDKYMAKPEKTRPPMLFVLDSLGMLSTSKEIADSTEGKDTKDMTRAQIVRAVFRVLTLKLARANIPFIVNNHVYAAVGSMFPSNVVAGGGGVKYACSSIMTLGKSQDKDGTEHVGTFIRVKMDKSRLSKENSVVKLRLSYKTGLDKWYGLLELAEKHGVFKKVSTRYELPDGRKVFGKAINDNPTDYYTPEIMELLEAAANKEFRYGADEQPDEEDDFFEKTEEIDVLDSPEVVE